MRFNALPENELQQFKLLPNGDYDFEVLEAVDKVSKAGKDMIALKLKVWDLEGKEYIVFDYLLEALLYKIKHFTDSVGLSDKYESGTLTADDCVGKTGIVDIYTQKDKTGLYPDKNAVKDYLVGEKREAIKPKKDDFIDSSIDELPF